MAGIRETIMNELGITSDDAKTLINGYGRNHSGAIHPQEIIRDVRDTADKILQGLPEYSEYDDFYHEVMECGKDRRYEAIQEASGGSSPSAESCLPSDYANDIDAWAKAVYHATQHEFECLALSNGIEGYRDYVSTLPYGGHSISRMADALNEETKTAEFLAKNGTEKDFQNYMIDISHNQKNQLVQHGCPGYISDFIFKSVTDSLAKGEFKEFERKPIMTNLAKINKCDFNDADEKQYAESLYLQEFEKGNEYVEANEILNISKSDILNKHDVLEAYQNSNDAYRKYLVSICKSENPEKNTIMTKFIKSGPQNGLYTDCKQCLQSIMYKNLLQDYQNKYDSLLNQLKRKDISGNLNVDTFNECVKNCGIELGHDNENQNYPQIRLENPHPTYDISFVGPVDDILKENVSLPEPISELQSLIDKANENTRKKTEKLLSSVLDQSAEVDSVTFCVGAMPTESRYRCSMKIEVDGKDYLIDSGNWDLTPPPDYKMIYNFSTKYTDAYGDTNEVTVTVPTPETEVWIKAGKYTQQASDEGACYSLEENLFLDSNERQWILNEKWILDEVPIQSFEFNDIAHVIINDTDRTNWLIKNIEKPMSDFLYLKYALNPEKNLPEIMQRVTDSNEWVYQENDTEHSMTVKKAQEILNPLDLDTEEMKESVQTAKIYIPESQRNLPVIRERVKEREEYLRAYRMKIDDDDINYLHLSSSEIQYYSEMSNNPSIFAVKNMEEKHEAQETPKRQYKKEVPSEFETITEQAEKEQDKKDKTKEESPAD